LWSIFKTVDDDSSGGLNKEEFIKAVFDEESNLKFTKIMQWIRELRDMKSNRVEFPYSKKKGDIWWKFMPVTFDAMLNFLSN